MTKFCTLKWARSWQRVVRGQRALARAGSALACTLALCLVAAVVPGCSTYYEAAPTRLTRTTEIAAIAPDAWPARSPQSAEVLYDQIGQRQLLVRRRVYRAEEDLKARDFTAMATISGKALLGQGLVLDVLAPVPPTELADDDQTTAEASTAPQSPFAADDFAARPAPASPPPPDARSLVFLSFLPDAAHPTLATTESGFGQTGLYFDVSSPPPQVPRRGIVVHFHGLGGTAYEQPVIDELLASGFVVLSADFPWNRWRPLTGTVDTLEDVHALSRELGRITDDVLSEAAYATEAATLYLQQNDPALADCPIVVLGFSAGSLVTPTCAARLADRCAGMVLVATGCNLVAIAQESELTNGGIRVMRFGKRISGAMSGLLCGTYLGYSKLDPWHTALACRRLPVLMVQGRSDTIVPTARGDELFERLNGPDLLSYPGGHRAVFFSMPRAAERIRQWVSDQTGPNRPTQARAISSAKPGQPADPNAHASAPAKSH